MSEIPQDLIDGLAGRYELRGVVGRGGMATVYGATDLKHKREVAIKVLKSELSATLGAERFLREIEIAAQLQHPHILMLIDSGQANDTFYYVMPLVDGGSLRRRIDEGLLGVDEATSITAKVADALGYAHGQGVVHRDIKPENILFSSGHPVVGDFGIARAISTAGATALTRTGFPLGTIGYMSPEQAAGAAELGPGCDVYSLACVTYEMLVGAVPGIWLSEAESDEGKLRDIPSDHRILLDELPRHVEPALARALARRPGDRYDDPAEFVAALRGEKKVEKRKYSEQNVGEIIQRAAESQFANPTADGNLTVGAIEAIAADVGLSPQRVHEAIMQLDSTQGAPAAPMSILSLPSHLDMEVTVPGELPRSEFGSVLEEIQLLGDAGDVIDTLGKSLSWQTDGFDGAGRTRIMARPRRGETTLSISQSTSVYKVGTTVASVVGGGAVAALMIAMGEIESISPSSGVGRVMIAVTAGAVPAALVAGRFYLRRVLTARRKKLQTLLDKLARVTREAVHEHTTD